MGRIHQLSKSVINKIAAGEVIERPASVVKELLENAVDSGATRIELSLEKGGTESIRVTDDGCGIAEDQLPLAISCHATSKIKDADDLFRVSTLGFRGEALASISEISRFTIRSRTKEADAGAELEVIGGEAQPIEPIGCPVGTTIEVRNLFFNVPVRQKFLKAVQTEMGHATEAFTRIAVAHNEVHFVLRHNGRVLHDLPPTADWRDRIGSLLGAEIAESLIDVQSENNGVTLSGYVANPMQSRASNRLQYLLLNGRAIRDRSLQHALSEAYRGLLLTGRYPICFLRLDMPPELVDVNVHPTKLEVRFQDSGQLYSQLLSTLRTRFLTTDLKARAHTPSQQGEDQGPSELVNWAKGELAQKRLDAPNARGMGDGPHQGGSGSPTYQPQNITTGNRATDQESLQLRSLNHTPDFKPFDLKQQRSEVRGQTSEDFESPPADQPVKAIQLHNRYLVVETKEGMEIIDQHALHERILYEEFRERVLSGSLESQKLLVPEPVDLSPSEAAAVSENRELLAKLGIVTEPFGGDTELVISYPVMLHKTGPAEVMRDLIEQLLSGGNEPEARDLLDELLHTMACKAAVKFGDFLTPEEIDSLLKQRHLAQDHHHCPHGRPTALVFTRDELDKQFKRI